MALAIKLMSNTRSIKTSRVYESVRIKFIEAASSIGKHVKATRMVHTELCGYLTSN